MAVNYTIFGKTVRPHVLAIGTIVTVVGGAVVPGFFKTPAEPAATPAQTQALAAIAQKQPIDTPAVASGTTNGEIDVEKAINDFLKSTETADK